MIGSSVDSNKLALSIKGPLYGIIPTVIFIAKLKGWDIGETDLTNLADGIVHLVSLIGMVVTAAVSLYGMIRRLYNKIIKK